MAKAPAPFSGFEWLIAWRYLRSRRAQGGISVITWLSLAGVMLGVAILIVVQAVMVGFREEITTRIIGANAHITLYSDLYYNDEGAVTRVIPDFDNIAAAIRNVPGVAHVAPMVRGQVMISGNGRNAGVDLRGERLEDLRNLPLVASPEEALGDIDRLSEGIALGAGVARELQVSVGDVVAVVSPEGVQTAFGATMPRINDYEVVYIFKVGRYDVDRTRAYIPLEEAQLFFNREGVVDEIEIRVDRPTEVEDMSAPIAGVLGPGAILWTWKQDSSVMIAALDIERRTMLIILSLVVLIAALNIISGLIMLVKNKGRDIGILRTMGLTRGAIMRVFFICGSSIGVIGTLLGVILGCTFAYYIQEIQALVEWISGGDVWNPQVRLLTEVPSKLRWEDIAAAMTIALVLSFLITLIPARNAARLDPVEALRYE